MDRSTVAEGALVPGSAYVATDWLALRDAPGGKTLEALELGALVQVTGVAVGRWQPVSANGRTGFVSNLHLRAPLSPGREALLQVTLAEWRRFRRGRAPEHEEPFAGYVGEMWRALGIDRDGTDRAHPWSAAFISFVVRKAGPAYAGFRFAAAHSRFVNDAIGARTLGLVDRPFWGYRITERRPEPGDIIQRMRGSARVPFDFAVMNAAYASHSDVVVGVRDRLVSVVGGNVGDSVGIRQYALDGRGFLKPGQGIISLLANRSDIVHVP